jgi:hypothetical protein
LSNGGAHRASEHHNQESASDGEQEYVARPERLIRSLRELTPSGAYGAQSADAFCRTEVLVFIRDTPKLDLLLISKLDGPPSPFVPLSAAENREAPPKRYVIGPTSL